MLGTFSEVPAVPVGHMLPLHQAACAFTAAHLDHSSKQSALHATHQHRPSLSAVQQVAAHKVLYTVAFSALLMSGSGQEPAPARWCRAPSTLLTVRSSTPQAVSSASCSSSVSACCHDLGHPISEVQVPGTKHPVCGQDGYSQHLWGPCLR